MRREEVASLAGISVTWYAWLEQGRNIRVSGYALDRLAKALRLSPSDTAYLYSLAGVARIKTALSMKRMDAGVQRALDGFCGGPAFVITAWWDVEAYNSLADYVFDFPGCSGPFARNHLWRLFRDPARRKLYVDWDLVAEEAVRNLRMASAIYAGSAYFDSLLADLVAGSKEFKRRWDARQTTSLAPLSVRIRVPRLGAMQFTSLRFRFATTEDRLLILLSPKEDADGRALQDTARSRLGFAQAAYGC